MYEYVYICMYVCAYIVYVHTCIPGGIKYIGVGVSLYAGPFQKFLKFLNLSYH